MAYKTDDWKINIKPYFWTELKVLFGVDKRESLESKKAIFFYRVYLLGYFILFGLFLYF
jgi:peroxiredoxin Q/BCP